MSNYLGEYVVWNPMAGKPRKRHAQRDFAEHEARRLAEHTTGEVFYVLKIVTRIVQAPPPPPPTSIIRWERD
jgi:hypothetical protein